MPPSGDLAKRVAALEQAVQQLAEGQLGSEAMQPNYLTVNVDGQVSADFSGIVNALGLILPAGTSTTTPAGANEVSWTRSSDGGMVANLWAGEGSNEDVLYLNAGNPAAPLEGLATLLLQAATTVSTDGLAIYNGTDNGSHSILASVANATTVIIDSNSNSAFVQIAVGARKLVLSWGVVTTGSTTPYDYGSNDWSVIGTATGATQISLGTNVGITPVWISGRPTSSTTGDYDVWSTDGAKPVISGRLNGSLTNGMTIGFVCLHD